jgi:hypothetical protein
MNERIRELLPNPFAVDYQYQEEPLDLYTEKEMIKFAELIVKECADVIFNGHFSDDECEGNSHRVSYNNGRFGAAKDIKKHFGVEE